MNGKIEITKELLSGARDYIPLAEKEAWAAEIAPRCFDQLSITADNNPMPPMYMVNMGLKSRYLMAALCTMYFGQKIENSDDKLMTEEEYDTWAGSHVFNQMERMKRDSELKFKAFDLMYDYKDLEKRLSTQISSLLAVQNDFVIRMAQDTASQVKALPEVLDTLKALQEAKEDGKQPAE